MTAFAAVAGMAGARSRHSAAVQRVMMVAAALVAIVVGGVWLLA
jgi:hypothetical protein